VREDGSSWYGPFKTQMQAFWDANGYKKQNVDGIEYGGLFPKKTTLLAGTFDLQDPPEAVVKASMILQQKIRVFMKTQAYKDGEPINVIAHSNGVPITLLALKGTDIKVNNLVLLSSPVDVKNKGNQKTLTDILNKNVTDRGHVYNVYGRDDGVAGVVGGARPWVVDSVASNSKFFDSYQGYWVGIYITKLNLTTQVEKGIASHNALIDPKMPFERKTHPGIPDKNSNDVELPKDVAPATGIQLKLIADYYAVLTGWK